MRAALKEEKESVAECLRQVCVCERENFCSPDTVLLNLKVIKSKVKKTDS